MGTRGFIVYRYKRRYGCKYNHFDSYPEGLGVALLREIPTDPDEFKRWLEQSRKFCDELYESAGPDDSETDSGWSVMDEQPQNDLFIEWVYEFDLDNLIFHIDTEPVFCLDNMPSTNEFLRCIDLDHYGYRAPAHDTPEQHNAFTKLVSPPPPVPDSALEMFSRLKDGDGLTPLHTLLSRSQTPSNREETCVRMLAFYIGLIMHASYYHEDLRDLRMIPDAGSISDKLKRFMYHFVRLAVCPLFYRKDFQAAEQDVPLDGTFWWFRKHICVRPSTHLDDEKNFQLATTALVSEITSVDGSPDIVYGIIFSLVHCAIIRVDKSQGGTFKYTEALPFLPSRFAESSSTPGITALVRVGDLPADDDTTFFYKVGQQSLIGQPERVVEDVESSDKIIFNNKALPLEILMQVADDIEDPDVLLKFASVSKLTMAAALPCLKYPQIDASWEYKTAGRGLRRPQGRLLLRAGLQPPVDAEEHDHLWRGRFVVHLDGKEVELLASRGGSSSLTPNNVYVGFDFESVPPHTDAESDTDESDANESDADDSDE